MLLKDFDMQRFIEQRKRLFKLIDREIAWDGHHKSYEGKMEICFANRFEYDEENPDVTIELSCYLAPIDGRGANFFNQEDLESMLLEWDIELSEREAEATA